MNYKEQWYNEYKNDFISDWVVLDINEIEGESYLEIFHSTENKDYFNKCLVREIVTHSECMEFLLALAAHRDYQLALDLGYKITPINSKVVAFCKIRSYFYDFIQSLRHINPNKYN